MTDINHRNHFKHMHPSPNFPFSIILHVYPSFSTSSISPLIMHCAYNLGSPVLITSLPETTTFHLPSWGDIVKCSPASYTCVHAYVVCVCVCVCVCVHHNKQECKMEMSCNITTVANGYIKLPKERCGRFLGFELKHVVSLGLIQTKGWSLP